MDELIEQMLKRMGKVTCIFLKKLLFQDRATGVKWKIKNIFTIAN